MALLLTQKAFLVLIKVLLILPLIAMAIVFLVNKLIKPENDLSRLNLPCRKEEVSLQRGILRRLVKNRADFRKMLITVSVRKSYLSPKALRGLLSWKI